MDAGELDTVELVAGGFGGGGLGVGGLDTTGLLNLGRFVAPVPMA